MLAIGNALQGLWQGYQQGNAEKRQRKLREEERAWQLGERKIAAEDRLDNKKILQDNLAWQAIQRNQQQEDWRIAQVQQGLRKNNLSDKLRAYLVEPDAQKRQVMALDFTPEELTIASGYPLAQPEVTSPPWFQLLQQALLPTADESATVNTTPLTGTSPDISTDPIVGMPPLSTTVEKLSWPAFPRNLSDEVKAGAYKNLLEKYFEEVPASAAASSYHGENGQLQLPLFNPFSGKYLRLKTGIQFDDPALGRLYHTGEGFRQRLANGQESLRDVPAAGELRNVTLPAAGGEPAKEITGIAYPGQKAQTETKIPALSPIQNSQVAPQSAKAAQIRKLMASFFSNNNKIDEADANDFYRWLERLLPEDPEPQFPLYLNNQPVMLPLSQVLQHPALTKPNAEAIKMTVKEPETGEELSMTPAEAQAWYRARASQLFNYTLPDGRKVALTGSELARLYPLMW